MLGPAGMRMQVSCGYPPTHPAHWGWRACDAKGLSLLVSAFPPHMDWSFRGKRNLIAAGVPLQPQLVPFLHPAAPPLPQLLYQMPTPSRLAYYETYFPLFLADWTLILNTEYDSLAFGSFREDTTNKVQVVHGVQRRLSDPNDLLEEPEPEDVHFGRVAEVLVAYPVTKLQWDPLMAAPLGVVAPIERLATALDCLRIYELDPHQNNALVERLALTSSKQGSMHTHPPLTLFDWNKIDPGLIITSLLDTTCTLWDIRHGDQAKTQLIAHDLEVFDVKFVKGLTSVFASVGNDGSMRVFDLRLLDHSTIIYDPVVALAGGGSMKLPIPPFETSSASLVSPVELLQMAQPLLRLATSNENHHHVATFGPKRDLVILLDMRFPGGPVAVLEAHGAAINDIRWHPHKNWLLSGSDDCQALVWDVLRLDDERAGSSHHDDVLAAPVVKDTPILAYHEAMEINNVCWDRDGDRFGVVLGKGFQSVAI